MHRVLALAAAWLFVMSAQTVVLAQTGVQPSDRYRDEFKLRPDTARISEAFSIDAWIVLLYSGRQGSNSTENPQDEHVDSAMESLRNLVKTDGEWLFWYRLNNYSIAKQLTAAHQAGGGLLSVENPERCRDALMAANRSRVMVASMPACEPVPSKAAAHTP